MALLADYAITPDVFDMTSYDHPATCDSELRRLKEILLSEGLVRDLRSGERLRAFAGDYRAWHRRGRELLKKLASQNRLVPFEMTRGESPADDQGWSREVLGTHRVVPYTGGVITTGSVKAAFENEPLVARIDRLENADWWKARSPSVRLARSLDEYREHLEIVLRCANSLMFIDPHLDLAIPRYRNVVELVKAAGGRAPVPAIEIHRVCYDGSGPSRRFPMHNDQEYFERSFRNALEESVRAAGLSVVAFIWDDFHDRYLILNLIGISLPNGFDTTTDPRSVTRWTRLGRNDRDDVQREFDPASRRHELRHRFVIE